MKMEEAHKEEYRDPDIVACGTKENVQQLFQSKKGEDEQAVKHRLLSGKCQFYCQTSYHKSSDSDSE